MTARFARQVSLAEIGTTGQARIEALDVRAGAGDARAIAVALDYLARAGARVGEDGDAVDAMDAASIDAIAGRPELVEAAAFLAGSLAATERLVRRERRNARDARREAERAREPLGRGERSGEERRRFDELGRAIGFTSRIARVPSLSTDEP